MNPLLSFGHTLVCWRCQRGRYCHWRVSQERREDALAPKREAYLRALRSRQFPGHRYRGEPCLYERRTQPDGRVTEQCERCGSWRYVGEKSHIRGGGNS